MLVGKMNRGKDGEETGRGETTGAAEAHWPAPTATAPIDARTPLPGSKSLTGRELVLAALADAPGVIRAPLHSRDTTLMVEALRSLGARFEEIPAGSPFGPDLRVVPADELTGSTSIGCGLAGTVMRFVPPVAALALGPVAFDGDPYARKRPMRPLLDALRALGADIADEGRGLLPFTVHGRGSLRGGRVEIDASLSSQFVSALLLSAARFDEGVHVVHVGDRLPSVPHIEMTLEALRARGVVADSPAEGEWTVAPGPIAAREIRIESDLSNAAPFLAAAVATGGRVTVPDWPESTTQVGDTLRTLLAAFGATAERGTDGALTVSQAGRIRGVELHVPEAGELAPTLVGLAALAAHGSDGTDGEPSTITGIGHIRHHETDRIAALVAEVTALGGRAEELPDGIAIHPAALRSGVWHSYADHRMATTGAVIGLRIAGVEVEDVASTAKTMPQFPELWNRMLGVEPPVDGSAAATASGHEQVRDPFGGLGLAGATVGGALVVEQIVGGVGLEAGPAGFDGGDA